MRFVCWRRLRATLLESRVLVTEAKNITLAFSHRVRETSFGELTHLLGFRFDEFGRFLFSPKVSRVPGVLTLLWITGPVYG
jgi:hypothetical protein